MRELCTALTLVAGLTLSLVTASGAADSQTAPREDLRARAWNALTARVQDQKHLRHALAVESILREMAAVAGEDKLTWGLAGLLHDIDLTATSSDLTKHGLVGAKILADLQFPEPVVHAVQSHDDRPGVPRSSRLDKALFCADQGYWLVMATGVRLSPEGEAPDAQSVWEQARSLAAKQDAVKKVSAECPAAGLSPLKVIELSIKGMRNTL